MLTPDQRALETGESSDTPGEELATPPTAAEGDRVGGRRFVPPGRPSASPQLDFPPVRNGIDYLASVVEHLDEEASEVEPRDLKYAVLHLQAAAEVLLKARLLREHWSLVFKDPGRATRERFERADFESCGTDAAVQRLRDIVGLTIGDKDFEGLKALAHDRNALQHWGLTHNTAAVEARAARVLDFLLSFLDDELFPLLQGPELYAAARGRDEVEEGVKNISAYVKRRKDRLRGELKEHRSLTIECPDCDQMTLVVAPDGGTCHFCGRIWTTGKDLLEEYQNIRFGPEPMTCPQCDEDSLVQGIIFADAPSSVYDLLFCFTCTSRYTSRELIACAGCGRPWPVEEAAGEGSIAGMCPECRNQLDPESDA
jgi:hypothetical protein